MEDIPKIRQGRSMGVRRCDLTEIKDKNAEKYDEMKAESVKAYKILKENDSR